MGWKNFNFWDQIKSLKIDYQSLITTVNDICLVDFVDFWFDRFQTYVQHLLFEIPWSGNNLNYLITVISKVNLQGFDVKLTLHFFASLSLALFISSFQSFWRPEKLSRTISAVVHNFSTPACLNMLLMGYLNSTKG